MRSDARSDQDAQPKGHACGGVAVVALKRVSTEAIAVGVTL